MERFDKFTDRARKVLTLAQDEAQRFNHNYIGTEHLLLGLVREGEGVAARVLENMNVELAKVRTGVEFIIGRGDRPVVGEVGLTPRAKRVIELAIDEARRLGHNYIGTEHLLLGLVREGEGIAAGVLESLGVNLDKVRHEVIRVLSQSSSVGPAQETKRSSKTPTVDALGINLTEASRAGKLDPVIGREKEIERVIQILGRKTKNNPALIGEPGAALERRCQRVMVEEPTLEQTIEILMGIRERYEQHHKVSITDDAVRAAADLSIRYITDRHLPDKAIDLIDEAASRVRLRHASAPPDLRAAQKDLDRVTKEKDSAINAQEYEKAATLREQEAEAREKVEGLRNDWQTQV